MAQIQGIDDVFWIFWRTIVDPALDLLMVLATVLFFYGLVQYLGGDLFAKKKEGDAARIQKGKQNIIYGILGFAIMAASKQIVTMICEFFASDCNIGG